MVVELVAVVGCICDDPLPGKSLLGLSSSLQFRETPFKELPILLVPDSEAQTQRGILILCDLSYTCYTQVSIECVHT